MNFSLFIENRIKNIQSSDSLAFALAIGVGPWVVPAGPAIVFGYALFQSLPQEMGGLRAWSAVSVAIGLIVAGATSSHYAIGSDDKKSWVLVIGYIVLEIAGLWAMSVTGDIKIIGTVASLLTLIVYLSRASTKKLDEAKSEAQAQNEIKTTFQLEQARARAEHKRELAVRQAELDHAAQMAKIEASKEKAIAKTVNQGVKSSVNPLQSTAPDDRQKAILSAFAQNPSVNFTTLASQLNVSRRTIYNDLDRMKEAGQLHKNGNGYTLPNGDSK